MPAPDVLLGTLVDNRYRLTRFLGSGAFGRVFLAEQLLANRVVGEVAVKLIPTGDDDEKSRVVDEVCVMAGWSHPHLLGYRTAGELEDGSGVFVVMELAAAARAA